MSFDESPRGRPIEHVAGDPDAIVSRAQKITDLGTAMASSSELLQAIKQDATEQQGKAIEALRTTIGDAGEKLGQAADLYSPVGPVLKIYGEELEYLKPKIDGLVDSCRELAEKVPAPQAPRADEAGAGDEDAQAAEEAQDAWEEEADLFDAAYDEWEDAFEKAVNGITDDMAGQIEDGGWRTFLAELGFWLEIAALILAIAALVITGPVIFWVALGVGLAALAVTIGQACYGDKDGWDIGLAVLGVIPFGKLGTGFAKSARIFGKTAPKMFQAASRFAPSLADAPKSNALIDTMMRGLSGKSIGDFHVDVSVLGASAWGPDMAGAAFNAIGGFIETGIKYYSGGITVSGLAS